jgi:hypothetical protein
MKTLKEIYKKILLEQIPQQQQISQPNDQGVQKVWNVEQLKIFAKALSILFKKKAFDPFANQKDSRTEEIAKATLKFLERKIKNGKNWDFTKSDMIKPNLIGAHGEMFLKTIEIKELLTPQEIETLKEMHHDLLIAAKVNPNQYGFDKWGN